MARALGATKPPNKELKLTKPGQIGASQLISSLRRILEERAAAVPPGSMMQGQAMAQVKKAVLDLVKKLPADCTLEDVQYQLYVHQKVERSMQAAAEARVTSHEQVKKRLSKWLAQ